MPRKAKEQKRKLPKHVDETFADDVERMDVDQLKAKVFELQKGLEDAEEFKLTQAYLDAKSSWDEVSGPVRDTITAVRAKTKFILKTMKDKGAI